MEILASAAASSTNTDSNNDLKGTSDANPLININSINHPPHFVQINGSSGSTISAIPVPPPLHQQPTFSSAKTDWHLFLSLEERIFIREKIKKAYRNRTNTYEELLETCCAIEEELMFIAAPSRLDYFKNGVQFEKRVCEKRKQLTGQLISDPTPVPSDIPEVKRSKTAH